MNNQINMLPVSKCIREKIHRTYGFSLAETLLAVLILLMVSSIVAAGIPSARNAYEKVVLTANADVLLSTTMTTLRNELGTATDIDIKTTEAGDDEITYFNSTRGSASRITLGPDPDSTPGVKTIVLYRYIGVPGVSVIESGAENIAMSSSSSNKRDLYVTYSKVEYDSVRNTITFSALSVKQTPGNRELSNRPTFTIRVIAE